MRRLLAIAAVLTCLAAGGRVPALAGQTPSPAPQAPPVTFRAEINYVEVDARILDAQGRFVGGLAPGDFEVLEDGRPQAVKVFSVVDIPVERAERPLFRSRPIERDVRTNLEGADGRIYLIVLDDLHTHPLRSTRVKAAARQFIERYVGANDTAAVVFTGGRSDAAQEFTTSQARLLRAVDQFMGRKIRSATLNRIEEEFRTRNMRQAGSGERIDDPEDRERGYQARAALETIERLSTYLGGIHGRRKALVLFSEGIDYDIYDVFGNRDASTILDQTRDLIAAATRANVAVYGVDARGLASSGDETIEVQAYPEDHTLGIDAGSFQTEVRLGQDSLRVLADETGGFAVVNRNDFGTAFQRIVDDNSSYYLLGYYSTNDRRDGRFRRIEVRVKNRPGLTVRARKGYVAPRGRAPEARPADPSGASAELRDAVESPLPLSALPMAVTAAVFKGPSPKGSVVVSTLVNGASLPLVERGGALVNDLEALVVATDEKGKGHPSERATVSLTMKPETAARLRSTGFRVIQSLDLPPGRYALRVAVREGQTKKAGSVTIDLDVPDFAKEKLLVSSLALTSPLSSVAPTARPKDPLEKLLPGPLSAYREFPRSDEIALFAEVYDTTGRQPHKVDIAITVKAEGGQTVFATKEERDSAELAGSAGGYGVTARIALADLAPGLYVLAVEATSRLGERREPAAREVVFRVLPESRP